MKNKVLLAVSMFIYTSVVHAQSSNSTDQYQTLDPANPPPTDLNEDEQKALVLDLQNTSNQIKNDLTAEEIDRLILVQLHQRILYQPAEIRRSLNLSDREFSEFKDVLESVRTENKAIVSNQINSMCEKWAQLEGLSEMPEFEKTEEALSIYNSPNSKKMESFMGPQSAINQIDLILRENTEAFIEYLSNERERLQNAYISTWPDTVRGTGKVKENIENHCNQLGV